MKGTYKVLSVVAALLLVALVLRAALPKVPSGTWASFGASLSSARANASAAMLADGRILISGGDAGSGPLTSVDLFGTGGSISAAAPMNIPRSNHFSVTLQDGRVLVGGGTSTGRAGATNAAEIYDPTGNTWTQISPMTQARSSATATLLQDGRVLIAGGDNSGTPNNTVEIFDPASDTFSFAGTMSTSRTKHAMAVLQDGRVLIVGGFDGTNPVASSDIFDPASDSVSAGPSLTTARYAHSATTLLNGDVAIIGGAGSNGNGGTTDLASIEIFNASTATFTSAGGTLATAREGHQAFLLPNNNNVLITGGTSAGTALASSELLTPQVSTSSGTWSYNVAATGAMTTARAGASGWVDQLNGPTSVALPKPGLLFVGGGSDASAATLGSIEAYGYSIVQTDQPDYPPGTTVNITGSGFQPNENVDITLVEFPLIDTHGPYTVQADGNGNISDASFTTDSHDANVRFWLSAAGEQSKLFAQNTFTDATNVATSTTLNAIPNPLTSGQSGLAFSGTVSSKDSSNPFPASVNEVVQLQQFNNANCTGNGTAAGSVTVTPSTATPSFNYSGTFTAPTVATTTTFFYITQYQGAGVGSGSNAVNWQKSSSACQGITVNPATVNTTTAVTSSANPSVYGQSVTFTATVTPVSGGNAPTGTVQFVVGGSNFGAPVSLAPCNPSPNACATSASISTLTVSGSPHSVSANYTPTGNFNNSSGSLSGSQTVTAKSVTATFTANNKVYDGTTTATQNTCTLTGVQAGDTGNVTCSASTLTFVDKNVGGGKTVNISGITLSGSATGNYTLTSTTASATANITALAITVTAAANTKAYDGTTSAAATPTITTGSLATGDTANFTEAYATKNVGTNLTLTPNGTVSDGNGGNNYTVTFASSNTGTITARSITVTAGTNTKQYDGTTSAAATPTITTGSLATGDSVNFTEAYASKNVGTGLTLVPTGSVSDGNNGNNYAVTFANNTTGVITVCQITVTAAIDTKAYDGTTSSTATPTITSGSLVSGDNASFTQVFDSKNAGTRTLTPSGSVSDGNGGSNYAVTFKTASGSITARPLVVTAMGLNKQYDGTTSATVTLSDNRISADVFTDGYTTATFVDKSVGANKTVTVTGISISGTDAGNYSVTPTTTTTTASITARPLTITATGVSKVYDGKITATVNLSDNRISGDVFTDSYMAANFSDANAGMGKTINVTGISIAGTDSGNYLLQNTTTTTTADVIPATLTLALSAASGTYTSMPFTALCTISGVVNGDKVAPSVTYSSNNVAVLAAINVGSYTATCTAIASANYQSTSANADFMITPAALTITANNATKNFGDTLNFAGTEFTTSGLLGSDTVTSVTLTSPGAAASANVAGSPYPITPNAAIGTSLGNYTINYVNGTLTVNKATFTGTATATPTDPGTVAYGQPLTVRVNLNSYSIGGVPLLQPHQDPQDNTKQLPETLTVYLVPFGGDPSQAVKFGASTAVPTYDNTTNTTGTNKTGWTATISGAAPTPGHYFAFVYGDDPGDHSLTDANVADSGYFYPDTDDISYPTLESGKIDVVQASVTGSFTARNKIYDGSAAATITSRSLTGVIGTDDVSLTAGSATFSDKNAGNGKIVTGTGFTLSGANAANYTLASSTLTSTASITPLTISGNFTATNKIYDATTAATIATRSLSGVLGSDAVQLYGGTATFSDKNVGTAKTVTGTGFTLTGGDAGNYQLASTTLTTTAEITALHVTGSFTADNKVYDGTTAATVLTRTVTPIAGDKLYLSGGTAAFSDKNVGTGKTVTLTGATLTGTDFGNYVLDPVDTSTASITPKPLTVSATGIDKVYDGTTAATVTLSDDRISGDVFTDSYVSATFANKNVGAGKTVSVIGISISGTDAGNYTFNTTASTTANTTPRPLTVTAKGGNKVYDGTSNATVTLSDDRVTGDYVSDSYASASFADKNVGIAKAVSVSGISINGTDAGNYSPVNTTASTTADITARLLTITATGVSKVYDGTITATVMLGDNRVSGDVFIDSYTSAAFSDKNVGTGKTVSVTGISISGTDAGNYTFNTTANTTANISAAPLKVTAATNTKSYDGSTIAAATPTASELQPGDTVTGLTESYTDKNVGSGKTLTVNAGYTINDGNSGNNYSVTTVNSTTGVINPAPLTITAVANTKTYDGTTSAAATPTTSALQTGDTVTGLSESYTDRNAGLGKALVVNAGYTVNDGNAGKNYSVSTVNNTTGVINPASLTITAVANTKTYDGTTSAAATPTTSGLQTGDTVTGLSESYTDTNAGSGKTLVVNAGYRVNDGNGGKNYSVSTGNNYTGVINPASLTITAKDQSKTYGATLTFSGNEFTLIGLISGDVVSSATLTSAAATASAIPGSYSIVPSAAVGTGLGNYTITYVNGTLKVAFLTGALCNNGLASGIILQPINADGSSVFKAGSTVPTKFVVCDANHNSVGPNAAFPNSSVVKSYIIAAATQGTVSGVDETQYSTTPDQFFRWDSTAQQWIFNQATGKATNLTTTGVTYLFQITLIDGTVISGTNNFGRPGYQYGLK
jgi:YDG domain/MBG domain (YGX type)/Kelch motif/Galactose oxidase, central domain